MMRLRFLSAALALLMGAVLAMPVNAEDVAGAEAARATIQSQLDAFRAESAEDAYEFAAPNIRRIFPTAKVFGSLVKRGYPMVWNPADAEFLDAKPRGNGIVQRLRFIDQQGRAHIGEYMMVQVNGEWRIAGVKITRDESFGV